MSDGVDPVAVYGAGLSTALAVLTGWREWRSRRARLFVTLDQELRFRGGEDTWDNYELFHAVEVINESEQLVRVQRVFVGLPDEDSGELMLYALHPGEEGTTLPGTLAPRAAGRAYIREAGLESLPGGVGLRRPLVGVAELPSGRRFDSRQRRRSLVRWVQSKRRRDDELTDLCGI